MKKAILYFLLFSSYFLHAQFYELGLGGSGTLFHGDVGAVGANAQGVYGFLPNNRWVKSLYAVNTTGIGARE